MSNSYFEFNGVTSSDMGLTIERFPDLWLPRKRMTAHQIPGRTGDLHQSDGTFENYPKRYQCWFKAEPTGEQLRNVAAWLSGAPAGARLSDTYDPDVYRLATYTGGAEVENIRNRYGRFIVEFDCDARQFLTSGDAALNITGSGLLNNQTGNVAYPLIEITGSVSGLVVINGVSLLVRFPGYDTKTLRVDAYLREAWDITDGGETSMNEWIAGTDFPVIVPGRNTIRIDGGIQSIRVYPRWWQI